MLSTFKNSVLRWGWFRKRNLTSHLLVLKLTCHLKIEPFPWKCLKFTRSKLYSFAKNRFRNVTVTNCRSFKSPKRFLLLCFFHAVLKLFFLCGVKKKECFFLIKLGDFHQSKKQTKFILSHHNDKKSFRDAKVNKTSKCFLFCFFIKSHLHVAGGMKQN